MLQRDPHLLEKIEKIETVKHAGDAYRIVFNNRKPTLGSGGKKGRWNSPTASFEILNTSLCRTGAISEFEAFLDLIDIRPDKPAYLHTLKINLTKCVTLDKAALEYLGVSWAQYESRDYSKTQEISDAANYLGIEAIIVPSAREDAKNLIVFMGNIETESVQEGSSTLYQSKKIDT